jgi:hypothetical protein
MCCLVRVTAPLGGVVTDEYAAMVRWWLAGEKLSHCPFIHPGFHMKWSGTEPQNSVVRCHCLTTRPTEQPYSHLDKKSTASFQISCYMEVTFLYVHHWSMHEALKWELLSHSQWIETMNILKWSLTSSILWTSIQPPTYRNVLSLRYIYTVFRFSDMIKRILVLILIFYTMAPVWKHIHNTATMERISDMTRTFITLTPPGWCAELVTFLDTPQSVGTVRGSCVSLWRPVSSPVSPDHNQQRNKALDNYLM